MITTFCCFEKYSFNTLPLCFPNRVGEIFSPLSRYHSVQAKNSRIFLLSLGCWMKKRTKNSVALLKGNNDFQKRPCIILPISKMILETKQGLFYILLNILKVFQWYFLVLRFLKSYTFLLFAENIIIYYTIKHIKNQYYFKDI